MRAWETKTGHSPCLNKPTKTGPTTCLPIWRPTLAWIASAPTRALGNSIGASDYLSDASCRLRPSVGCGQVVGKPEVIVGSNDTSRLPERNARCQDFAKERFDCSHSQTKLAGKDVESATAQWVLT